MTLTIDVAPERQALLDQEAARRGVSPEQLAGDLLNELLEDLEDVAGAREILANSDPTQRRSLSDLRQAIYGDQANG